MCQLDRAPRVLLGRSMTKFESIYQRIAYGFYEKPSRISQFLVTRSIKLS